MHEIPCLNGSIVIVQDMDIEGGNFNKYLLSIKTLDEQLLV